MRVEAGVDISRPIEQVFPFVSDRANDSQWASGNQAAHKITPGPVGVGTEYRLVGRFLGREVDSDATVIEYEPGRKTAYRSAKPFPLLWTYVFSPEGRGTKITLVVEGEEPKGFFRLAGPVFASAVRRQFAADLGNLKDLLESETEGQPTPAQGA